MPINPKQSKRLVKRQLERFRKRLAEKEAKLAKATYKPHITNLKLQIAGLKERIAECEQWLRERGEL